MKLLYIHQYFVTPDEPGGTRSYWFAKTAVEHGHEVTVITGRNDQEKLVMKENVDGITVVYVRNPYRNEMSYMRRIWSFARFMTCAVWLGLKEKNVNLVFATSTPLSVGVPALIIKWLKRKRYIFEVRDLWPEAPIQLGIVKNKLLIRLLRSSERIIYHSASHIIALSPGIREGIRSSGVEEEQITMIPNMSKKSLFYPHPPNLKLASALGIDTGCFNAVHFGALGFANGLDYVIEAANLLNLQGINDIHFIFAGEGKMEKPLKEKCAKLRLKNVKFLGAHPMKTTAEIVNLCDCSLVMFSDVPVLYTNSPNKLFDSLSAGKPVVINSNGWTRSIVEDHRCGKYADPSDPADLARVLVDMKDSSDELSEMKKNCRMLAEQVYDKSILTGQFLSVIEKYAV